MAPKTKKKSKKKNSTPSASTSSSTLSFQVVNTCLPQTLPGGLYQTSPHQFDGPRNAFEAKTVEEGFYVRIDMPGVEKGKVKVRFENKKLSFGGKASQVYPHYESGLRSYSGEINFRLDPLEVSQFEVDMNNGVLRVVLVGSGFPPNYNAASSHASRKVPELPTTLKCLNNEVMLKFDRFRFLDPPANFVGMYPFQLDGPKGTFEMRALDGEYCFLRIDMPDVDEEGLTLRMSDRKVSYGGNGVKGSKYDESKRLYFGEFQMQCPCCNFVDTIGAIIDGILRVLIKKKKVEAVERIGTSCPEDGSPRPC